MAATAAGTLRRAAPEDFPAFFALVDDAAREEGDPLLDDARRARLKDALSGERPRVELFVADAGDRLTGYATVFEIYSTFLCAPVLYLEHLYVTPAARGRGLGARFMAFLAAEAKRRDCPRLAWVVDHENATALRLYARAGSRHFDRWAYHVVQGDALDALAARGTHST